MQVALGFDSFLVMRHGISPARYDPGSWDDSGGEPEPEAAASQDMDVDREQGFWHERGTLADLEGVWCAQGDNLPEGGVAVCVNRGGDFLLHNQSCKMAQKGVRGPTDTADS